MADDTKRTAGKIAFGGVLLSVLGVLVLGLLVTGPSRRARAQAVPPAHVTNLVAFLLWKPNPLGAFQVEVQGTHLLVLTGPAGQGHPSGLAAYVFDPVGRMVGWSHDVGDQVPTVIGGAVNEWQPVAMEEVRRRAHLGAKENP